MSARFEVIRNGKRICIAGIDGNGVLAFGLTYVKHPESEGTHELNLGGLGLFDGGQDHPHHARWSTPHIDIGDEITIRVLEPGAFDEPLGMIKSPQHSVSDPDWGTLNYYIDSWDTEIEFDSPPFQSAHIRLCADETGPTQLQRDLVNTLKKRHSALWQEISVLVLKCVGKWQTVEEMVQQLDSRIGVSIYRDTQDLEIVYSMDTGEESRAVFVTLRDWEVVEVSAAD